MKLINLTQVAAKISVRGRPCSRTSLYRYRKLRNFPEPRKRYGSPMWNEQEVDDWIENEFDHCAQGSDEAQE